MAISNGKGPSCLWSRNTCHYAAGALLSVLVTLALLGPEIDGGQLRGSDHYQNDAIAYNLATLGEHHSARALGFWRATGKQYVPYYGREPGYPAYLALIFMLPPGLEGVSIDCLSDGGCAAGRDVRRRVQQVNTALAALLVLATFVATRVVLRYWSAAYTAGLLMLLMIPGDDQSLIAALLLLGHSVFGYLAYKQRDRGVLLGAISGLFLGLLILIKAVFQYWLLLLLLGALAQALIASVRKGRRASLVGLVIAVTAGAITVPWMVRNQMQVGRFTISGRDGGVLSLRAEYNRMTWGEVLGSFAYYLPREPDQVGRIRQSLMRWLKPDRFGYQRLAAGNREGFFHTGAHRTGEVAARATRLDPDWDRDEASRDLALLAAARAMIRENWVKHMVLSIAFAQCAMDIGVPKYTAARQKYGRAIDEALTGLRELALYARFAFVPALFGALLIARTRRSFALAFLFLPSLYSFMLYAVATRCKPRYSVQLTVILILAFVFVVATLVSRIRGRARGARNP